MFPLKPFIEVVTTGCDAEYMTSRLVGLGTELTQAVVAPLWDGRSVLAGGGARRCMQPVPGANPW